VAAPLKKRIFLFSEMMDGLQADVPGSIRCAEPWWVKLAAGARLAPDSHRRPAPVPRPLAHGQFWFTLSSGTSTAIIGLTWPLLWKVLTTEMLPFLALSLAIWRFPPGILAGPATVFSANVRPQLGHRVSRPSLVRPERRWK